jgi:hypothetical protein
VLNEILAKLNQNEKLMGGGAVLLVLGWLIGFLLASASVAGVASINVFNESGGTGLGFLALLGAIAIIAILYVKVTPTVKVNWPAPLELIELIIAAVVGLIALYLLYTNFSHSNDWNSLTAYCGLASVGCPSWPITDWVAVLAIVVGAGLMAYGAYMAWVAAGKPTAAVAK